MDLRRRPVLLGLSELALTATTIAAAIGMGRLFEGSRHLVPLVAAAVTAHLLALAVRRSRLPALVTALVTPFALLFFVSWVFYLDTTTAFIPTGTTIDAIRLDIDFAVSLFGNVKAPVVPETGFLVMSVAGIFLAATLADTIAFRVWVALEALAPVTMLLIFVAMLGSAENRVQHTALLVVTMLCFLLTHRVLRQDRTASWLAEHGQPGTRTLLRVGAGLVAVVALAAVLVGPQLPGAEEAAWDWENIGDDPGGRQTQSPLVSMQDRLVNQSDEVMFTVQSTDRSYWRTMSLESFNGVIFRAENQFKDRSGDLPGGDIPDGDAPSDVNRAGSTFTIRGLNQLWLPVAFQPRSIEMFNGGADDDFGARYNAETSTLTIDRDHDTSDGSSYEVISEIPVQDPALLRAADSNPGAVDDVYLELPGDFSPSISDEARRITAGATNDFDRAIALQEYFRSFDYSIDVNYSTNNKHSTAVMEEFLNVQVGYCEQFATTFAAMARVLGIPSRVAVGFTWGTELGATNGIETFEVKGRHGHAWPELYFSGYGWVDFEPTPSRGNPQALHTGVPQDQANDPGQATPEQTTTTVDDGSAAPPPTTAPPTTRPAPQPAIEVNPVAEAVDSGPAWWSTPVRIIGAVLGVVLAYVALMLGWRRMRRARRHRAATTPPLRVRAAWDDALEDLMYLGAQPERTETHLEFASRAAVLLPESGEPARQLADQLSSADYSATPPADAEAERCEAAAGQIATLVRQEVSPIRRTANDLKPTRRRRS
jgi:transglutaminase-like putative cysteine protease